MTEEGAAPSGDEDEAARLRAAKLAALLRVEIADSVGELRQAAGHRRTQPEPEQALEPDAELEPAPAVRPSRRRSRVRQVLSFAVLAALLLSGVGLAYAGSRIIRSSTQGQVLAPIDDPSAPGFEAIVDATPTIVILHDSDGLLDSVTVLSLPDPDGGGGVLMVPARTVRDLPVYGLAPIEIAYDLGDAQIETQAVGGLLGTAPGETAVVDAARWADLTAPVAPITVDNPNEIVVDGETVFAEGEIDLEAEDVGPYLEATVEGESDLARLFRHELFWRAWIDAVAEDGSPEAVPGELDSGIGRFVRTLAAGDVVVETLPVQEATEGRFGEEEAFVPRSDEIAELVDRLVPFPVSPAPGERARLRLLNGTPDTSVAATIAGLLPPAGVQVVIIGNAATTTVETTTVRYVDAGFRDEAEAVVDILGVGEAVEDPQPSDVADITVTLGADYG